MSRDYCKTTDKSAPAKPIVHTASTHYNNDYLPQMQHQLDIQNNTGGKPQKSGNYGKKCPACGK